ncbi:LysR family transcriptional regulator [Parashewanella tropica]|uniref:LysR family transcriptional regulator n=1 Tax=Parashewanella tropica TaxID=2547970 RepID=UPI0010598476|nr:LysR family transcriptional regulator [Parashewanella tropica]
MKYQPQLLDGILIFNQVIQSNSFTKAAEVTGHSPSHISKEVNKLESRLGVRLLNRTTRKLSLTPEGEQFHQHSLQLIQDTLNVQEQLQGLQHEPSGLLRVSCMADFQSSKMQKIIDEFLEQYPKVKLEMELSNRRVDIITEGFDLVMRATRDIDDSSFICRKLLSFKALTLASPEYLTRFGTPTKPEDLTAHHCLGYSHAKNPNVWGYQSNNEKENTIPINVRFQSNDSEMLVAMCTAGKGIARMPSFLLDTQLEQGKLISILEGFEDRSIDVYFMYPSKKHLSSKVRAFIDFIVERL